MKGLVLLVEDDDGIAELLDQKLSPRYIEPVRGLGYRFSGGG